MLSHYRLLTWWPKFFLIEIGHCQNLSCYQIQAANTEPLSNPAISTITARHGLANSQFLEARYGINVALANCWHRFTSTSQDSHT